MATRLRFKKTFSLREKVKLFTFFTFLATNQLTLGVRKPWKFGKFKFRKIFTSVSKYHILSIWLQYDYSVIIVKIRVNELIKFSGIPDPFSDVFIHFHRTYLFVDFKNFLITSKFSKTMRKNINFPSRKPLFRSLSYRWLWDSSRRSLKTIDFCAVWTYWYENLCD